MHEHWLLRPFLDRLSTHLPSYSLLIKEPDDLSGDMLPPRLLVIHDTRRGCKHNETELTRWQQLDNPLLKVGDADIVARGDDAGFVDANGR